MTTVNKKSQNMIDPNFIYLSWRRNIQNKRIQFQNNHKDSIKILSTIGPYKNVYSQQVFNKNNVYIWQIKIINGTYFKIGVIKESQINSNTKMKAFSDSKLGYALFSVGKLRYGSNKDGIQFGKGYGPGDIVNVKFDTKEGTLSFAVNDDYFKQAFSAHDFTNGGYVAAVAALHEEARFSLTLPILQD